MVNLKELYQNLKNIQDSLTKLEYGKNFSELSNGKDFAVVLGEENTLFVEKTDLTIPEIIKIDRVILQMERVNQELMNLINYVSSLENSVTSQAIRQNRTRV